MAVLEKFGDETDINLPAESIGKVIFIIQQYPTEIWASQHAHILPWESLVFPEAVFDRFGDETGINLIARQYVAEIVTTSIFNLGKILYFQDYLFQWPFSTYTESLNQLESLL